MNNHNLTTEQVQALRDQCLAAREYAYAPYSKFRVGCAILTKAGSIVTGANVENASYGAGICAERTAITRCVMEGQKELQAIAILSDMADCVSPCGICRQFIREFAPKVPVLMFSGQSDKMVCHTLEELLPLSFGPEHLH